MTGLSELDSYRLDVYGYVVLTAVLDRGELGALQRLTAAEIPEDRPVVSWAEFLGWDQRILDLIGDPRILPVVTDLCGGHARLDSAMMYQTSRTTPPLELHPVGTELRSFTDRRYAINWATRHRWGPRSAMGPRRPTPRCRRPVLHSG
jgi:hypothetical protein